MKNLLALLLFVPTSVSAQEVYSININRLCSAIVEIPYASDNFSDKKWEEFKDCLKFIKLFQED